jgi:hypothetical protein
LSGWFRGGFGRFAGGRRRSAGSLTTAPVADLTPRARGPVAFDLPEPQLFRIDYRNDFLLRLDATISNRGEAALTILDVRAADVSPVWDGPRAEWWENGSVRRAVFRVEPWLPLTLAPGESRPRARLLFELAPDRVPARGAARVPLTLVGEPFGELRFELRVSPPAEE